MRETPKLGLREGSIVCLIYEQGYGVLSVKMKIRVRASGA